MHVIDDGADAGRERDCRPRAGNVGAQSGNQRKPARSQQPRGFGDGRLEVNLFAVDPRAVHIRVSIALCNGRMRSVRSRI